MGKDRKYLIKVNDKEYHSYKDLSDDLGIDYGEFMRAKLEKPRLTQLDLLSRFYTTVLYSISDDSYIINMESKR